MMSTHDIKRLHTLGGPFNYEDPRCFCCRRQKNTRDGHLPTIAGWISYWMNIDTESEEITLLST